MISYWNSGLRDYGDPGMRVHARRDYEFQLLLSNNAWPTLSEGAIHLTKTGPSLWVFAPICAHGWAGIPGKKTEVCVAHVPDLLPGIRALLPNSGWIGIPLNLTEARECREAFLEMTPHMKHRSSHSQFASEAFQVQLGKRVAAQQTERKMDQGRSFAEWKVAQATRWFRERMQDSPSVQDVAQAVHVSPTHLRRLFARSERKPPHQVFHELRMQSALDRVVHSHDSFSAISDELGFSDPSAFSRAFRQAFGRSPRGIRETTAVSTLLPER